MLLFTACPLVSTDVLLMFTAVLLMRSGCPLMCTDVH
jgi:hypothetical protein